MFNLYNILGLMMFTWYVAIRWTLLGNELGKFILINNIKVFKLNWWFAPINILTALLSIVFIAITLFTFERSLNIFVYWLGIFLLARNLYYTIEDIIDYRAAPTKLQFIFVILDILMAIYVLMWIMRYKALA